MVVGASVGVLVLVGTRIKVGVGDGVGKLIGVLANKNDSGPLPCCPSREKMAPAAITATNITVVRTAGSHFLLFCFSPGCEGALETDAFWARGDFPAFKCDDANPSKMNANALIS